MFDLIIMLSRYLFVIYIGLYLWEAIVYIAYEQGGYLGSLIGRYLYSADWLC